MHLAIVIPALNEERSLEAHLSLALDVADEVIVADGGSEDATAALARRRGALVVVSAPGRGVQLNCGARLAIERGAEALVFLHADTRLPAEARPLIEEALRGGAVGGGCHLRFTSHRPILELGSRLVNLRSRLFRVPLGDQAQFAAREAFLAAGGFPPWPILEDLELLKRLRRQGRLVLIDATVETDARRFEQRGIVRTVTTNWLVWLLYLCGVSPHRLARLYRHVR